MNLQEKIENRVLSGKEGALAVAYNEDGKLCAAMGRELCEVVHVCIALNKSDRRIRFSERNFAGRIIIDEHGADEDAPIRMVLLDEQKNVQLSTERDLFHGSVFIAALTPRGKPFAYSALLHLDAEVPQSAVLWDCSHELVFYLNLQTQLLFDQREDKGNTYGLV